MAKKKVDPVKQELEFYLSNPLLTMESKGWTKAQYDEVIVDLEKKIENSKRGRSSKTKGSTYERDVARIIKTKLDIDLKRTPQSGGFAKDSKKADEFRGDIVSIDDSIDFKLHIECKNHSSWSLPSWLKQAEEDCPDGKVPVVVYHRRQKNLDGKRIQDVGDYVSLSLEDFLDIVDKSKIVLNRPKKSLKLKKLREEGL